MRSETLLIPHMALIVYRSILLDFYFSFYSFVCISFYVFFMIMHFMTVQLRFNNKYIEVVPRQ